MTTMVYNLKTDFGADNALGNGQKVLNKTLSITSGLKVLSSPTAIWTPGGADDGKAIGFPTTDTTDRGCVYFGSTIASVAGDGKSVTITDAFTGTTMSSATGLSVEWGHNDTPAFIAFKAAALAYQALHPTHIIELDVVGPGRFLAATVTDEVFHPFKGIKNFNLVCSGGAIISNCNGGLAASAPLLLFGSNSVYQDNVHSAHIATVSAGATSVFVMADAALPGSTTVADGVGLFTVGQWAMVTGGDFQGGGFPTSPWFHDYVLVSDVNPSTGEVTFATTPLNHYYKSTWPWPTSNAPGYDGGGPASITAIHPGWDVTHNYIDVIIDMPSGYGSLAGRDITWTNPTFIDATLSSPLATLTFGGFHPTVNQTHRFVGGTIGGFNMEVDKLITTLSLSGVTSPGGVLGLQTGSSMENFVMDDCTIYQVTGSARHNTITNSTFIATSGFIPTPRYGRTESIVLTNNVIPGFNVAWNGGAVYYGPHNEGANNTVGVTMVGGVLTIPISYIHAGEVYSPDGVLWWMCEGSWVAWRDQGAAHATPPYFRITDVTCDSDNVYVTTTWTGNGGGFPSWSFNTLLGLEVHHCPSITVTNCTATAPTDVDDGSYLFGLTHAPAGAPLGSYQKETFTNLTVLDSTSYFPILGYIKKFNVTVNTPSTDPDFAATLQVVPNYASHEYFNSDYDLVSYTPTFNLKSGGTRSLLAGPTGYPVSWDNGGATGDTLPALTERLWWPAEALRITSVHAPYAWTVTLELQTDQGLNSRNFICTFT